jgi:hypothetical protein
MQEAGSEVCRIQSIRCHRGKEGSEVSTAVTVFRLGVWGAIVAEHVVA